MPVIRSLAAPMVAALCLAVLTACPRGRLLVRVEGRTHDGRPRFVVSDEDGRAYRDADEVTVFACGNASYAPERTVWQVRAVRKTQNAPGIARQAPFVYGATPPGWVVLAEPVELTAGCYEVDVHGSTGELGGAWFTADSVGTIRQLSGPPPRTQAAGG